MSGIAGIIRFDGGPVDQKLVERMTQTMAYRGPDGISHWSNEHAALGHCMLQTTPESLEERQPLSNEDETLHLVLDGRVDNWEELRILLKAEKSRLRTRSDAELVLRAYERWGEACLKHIDGDFALAIWDSRQRKLFCARDRTGSKPFVYHWDGHCLVFASEIHTVLAGPNVPREMNQGALAEHLALELVSREETLWHGVTRLTAAHSMTVDENGPRIVAYWHPEQIPLIYYRNDSDYIEHYREVLFEAVRRQSRSHRPVGFEVSGGLDSSSMFAIGDQLHREGRLPAPNIDGFTLKFEKGTAAYELDFAHAVGSLLGRAISEIPPMYRTVEWLRHEARKFATVPNFPNTLPQRGTFEAHQRNGGRAVIGGGGGDQWLDAGNNDLAECLQIGAWRELGKSLHADYTAYGTARTLYGFIRHGIYPNLPSQARKVARWGLLRKERKSLLNPTWLSAPMQKTLSDRLLQNQIARDKSQSHLRIGLRERLLSLTGGFPTFTREIMERTGSNAGIEYRSPFYNNAFLEVVLGLPLTQLRRAKNNRYIHRESMAGLLPEGVRKRKTKAEFTIVIEPYKKDLAALPPPTNLPARDWFTPEVLEKKTQDLLDPKTYGIARSASTLITIVSCCEIVDSMKK